MSPEEFIKKWGVSRFELCDITGKSIDTVNHWFSQSSRQPTEDVYTILSFVDSAWTNRRYEEENLPEKVWIIYEMLRDRAK